MMIKLILSLSILNNHYLTLLQRREITLKLRIISSVSALFDNKDIHGQYRVWKLPFSSQTTRKTLSPQV